jgi:hypothetical protein
MVGLFACGEGSRERREGFFFSNKNMTRLGSEGLGVQPSFEIHFFALSLEM